MNPCCEAAVKTERAACARAVYDLIQLKDPKSIYWLQCAGSAIYARNDLPYQHAAWRAHFGILAELAE